MNSAHLDALPRSVNAPTREGPAHFPRRILLAVSGLSPQIVTETIYALAAQSPTPFIPTEVHLITTREGAQRAELSLLSDDLGWFHRLCADYCLPPIAFTRQHIHIVRDAQERGMDDIRSVADNQAAADFITSRVREFTADPDCALHVSIAGGRKTMGFYLGYALSLYGRPQDRLSHVLVSEPFENSMDFFYPTPYSRVLQTRDGKLADTAMAEVTLAEIPFVSLRHGLPQALLSGHASFSATVAAAQRTLAPPSLLVRPQQRELVAAGKTIKLPPAELAFYCLFIRRCLRGQAPLAAPPKAGTDEAWAHDYLREYRAIVGPMGATDTTERTLSKGMDGDYFSTRKSKLHAILTAALGPAAGPYLIRKTGTKSAGKYQLGLSAEFVRFDDGVVNVDQQGGK